MTLTLETFADLDLDREDRIVVHSDFRVRDSVQAVPGARWDSTRRVWTVPRSMPSLLALRTEFGESLEHGPSLTEWAKDQSERVDLLRQLRPKLDFTGVDVPRYLKTEIWAVSGEAGMARLFPYQWVAAACIRVAGDYLLLDDMGLGKTVEALAGIRLRMEAAIRVLPVLVVCPKSVIGVWVDEIATVFPDAVVSKVRGTPTAVKAALEPGADFYVINYDLLRRYSRLAPFGSVKLTNTEKEDGLIQRLDLATVIADEVHRAAHGQAKQTRAVWQAMAGPSVTTRLGLTGTPIQDSPEQLWSPLRATIPYEYGYKTEFLRRYTVEEFNHWGGREIIGMNPLTQGEFEANFHARSRRIVKEAALPFLPPKVYEVRWVELPASMRKAYRDMKRVLIAELESGDTLTADSVLEKAIRLLQLANASGEVIPEAEASKFGPKFRMTLPSPKIEAFLTDLEAGDFPGSVAVFTDSRQLADLLLGELERKGYTTAAITGAVTGPDRDEAIRRFQAGEVRVMVFTRAGGEGVTLTAASVLVRLIRAWSYTVHTQVEDRLHRIGAEVHPNVTIIDYLTESTVEEGQLARLAKKEAAAEEVLRDKDLLAMLKAETE